jgi:hypothetical protein
LFFQHEGAATRVADLKRRTLATALVGSTDRCGAEARRRVTQRSADTLVFEQKSAAVWVADLKLGTLA